MSQRQKGGRKGPRDSGRGQRNADEEEESMETQETQGQSISQASRQAQKTADSMDSALMARKVSELVRYLLCAEQKKIPVRRKELTDKILPEYSRAFPVIFQKANEQLQEVFGMEAKEIQRGKVSELVRYLLCAEQKKIPVHRKELTDKILPEYSWAFPVIFEKANEQMQEVFEMEAKEIQTGKVKCYILVNALPLSKRDNLVEWSHSDTVHAGLLSVVLSLIMMKQGPLKEEHLWVSLKRLGIDPEQPHRQFGDVQRLITRDFVEQMYLDKEREQAGDSYIFRYSWGPRAKQEIDKRELLAMVAEIYGGDLAQWEKQFLDSSQPSQMVEN